MAVLDAYTASCNEWFEIAYCVIVELVSKQTLTRNELAMRVFIIRIVK